MEVNQAWQTVLGQLQKEMNRGNYDTWVRDTKQISYEDGLLTIGVRNADARDWLESRLSSTVSRLLIGIMNRTVDVVFVVDWQESDGDSLGEDEDEQVGGEPFSVQSAEVETEEDDSTAGDIIEAVSLDINLMDDFYLHDKVVAITRYISERLSAETGAKAAWLYPAFIQAFFEAGVHNQSGVPRSLRAVGSTSPQQWSIFSHGAYWRVLKSELPKLRGILEKVERPKGERYETYRRGNRTFKRRLPTRYRLYFTPRMAKLDVAWVHVKLSQAENVKAGLREILKMPSKQLKDALFPIGSNLKSLGINIEGIDNMLFVSDIIRALTGEEDDLPAELSALADKVHLKIINLWGKIILTHYFMYRVIPRYNLTPHQAWLLVVARGRGYFNSQTGEMRPTATFQGGYEEMAALCGMYSWKGVAKWLRDIQEKRGGDLTKLMREIADEKDPGYGKVGQIPRTFWVQIDDYDLPPLDSNGSHIEDSNGSHVEDSNGSHVEDSNGSHETIGKTAPSSLIKYLKTPLNTSKHLTTRTSGASGGSSSLSFDDFSWNWEVLLNLNPGLRKDARNRIRSTSDPAALVSWLLYAYSPEGEGIKNPSVFALSKLQEDPDSVAPQAYLALAEQGPAAIWIRLTEHLDQLERSGYVWSQTDHPGWYRLFGKVKKDQLIALKQRLFDERDTTRSKKKNGKGRTMT